MKITRAQSQIVRLPSDEPLAGGPAFAGPTAISSRCQLGTDAGHRGHRHHLLRRRADRRAQGRGRSLGALAVGEDPLRIEAIVGKLRDAAGGCGPGGIFTLALSAIDIALWDIKGKALNQPLSKLLGGFRERVPTYASGALMRSFTLEHVVEGGAEAGREGLPADEDAARAARRHHAGDRGRARAADPRGDRRRTST